MSISTIHRETTRPPIALTHQGLLDHAATRLGLWLLHWAKSAEARRAGRPARRQERLARQAEFDRMLDAIADRQARHESTLVLRTLR
jgi:hypothetical protein